MKKGERVTIRHALAWGGYVGPKGREDELAVKLSASDASITVPAKLTLNFEKHEFGFEYEVRAGDKAGEFTVTLTPEVGKPVVVRITVR